MSRLLLLLSLFTLAFALPAQAQDRGYRYTLPTGWSEKMSEGTLMLMPPAERISGAAVSLLPLEPASGGTQKYVGRVLKELETSGQFSNMRYVQTQAETAGAAETLVLRVSSEDGWAIVMIRAENGLTGGMALVALNENVLTRQEPAATAIFASLHLAKNPKLDAGAN